MTARNLPKTLHEAARGGRLIPFVGAGVSMAVRRVDGTRPFPSWPELLAASADRLGEEDLLEHSEAIRALLRLPKPDFFDIAKRAHEALGSATWRRFLVEQLEPVRAEISDDSLALARAIWALGSKLVVTTNYDRVLGWACPRADDLRHWRVQSEGNLVDLLGGRLDRPCLWQLHGSIDEPTQLILTPDGYRELYGDDSQQSRYEAALTGLRNVIAGYHLLFVGFSLDDEYVARQFEWVRKTFRGCDGPHYVLVRAGESARMREKLAGSGIQAICFEEFGEPLLRLLRMIADARLDAELPKHPSTDDPQAAVGRSSARVVVSAERFKPVVAPSETPQADTTNGTPGFVQVYRARLDARDDFWLWEAPRKRGARLRMRPKLDEMYVPLRIGNIHETDDDDDDDAAAGTVIDADRLLAESRSLIVRGGAGSGKSTWLRWLFRRLLEHDDVLPIFLELRGLADRWAKLTADQPRSFERYLKLWLEEKVGAGYEQSLFAALDETYPQPVILVDGWDELGDFGAELGPQLASFARLHSEVVIVATSRPYGEGISELEREFAERELLPMSDDEIARFVGNYFQHVTGGGRKVTERFLANLVDNKRARDMARKPHLLGMLLTIGADRQLPDQRHELYRQCLEELLDSRPKRRQALGALMSSQEWAPDSHIARLLATAKLAWVFHHRFLTAERMGNVIPSRRELIEQLHDWEPYQRECFINWLVNGAGMLIERDDGKLQFSHLGFQEYLAAYHLNAIHNTEARTDHFLKLASDVKWWEVLRLWAALGECEYLPELAARLLPDAEGFWLAGAVLADGLAEPCWEPWLRALPERFEARPEKRAGVRNSEWSLVCANAWRSSQQHRRRSRLNDMIRSCSGTWTWLDWQRAFQWADRAGLEGPFAWEKLAPAQRDILGAMRGETEITPELIARGRVALISSPTWRPRADIRLLGLRIWPGRRMLLGWYGQVAATLGAPASGVEGLVLETSDRLSEFRKIDLNQLKTYANWLKLQSGEGWEYRRHMCTEIERYAAMDGQCGRNVEPIARESGISLGTWTEAPLEWMKNTVYVSMRGADLFGSDKPTRSERWRHNVDTVRYFSSGYAGARVALAYCTDTDPLIALLRTACGLSLEPTADPSSLYEQLKTFSGPRLWSALACHVARVSTLDDRAYLEEVALNPDQIEDDVLRWGLKYWVRGDIMLDDGSTVTLDEIWGRHGRKPLVCLEDMPPELNIDWDAILK